MLFLKFIGLLIWYLIRNIVCCPFVAIATAWEDAYNNYTFTRRMRKQSAAQKRKPNKPIVWQVKKSNTPPVKFVGPQSEDDANNKKRHRRGHRGGRKHKRHGHHHHHGGGTHHG